MPGHFLDLSDPAFSTRSEAVHAARAAGWYARTPYGLAVLRHREAGLLLRDRRFRQGSHAWPRLMGLEGPFADFWTRSVIAREGAEHKRLRAILQAALRREALAELVPAFEEIASDLLGGIEDPARVEAMSRIATPFAGQAIAALLGLSRDHWRPLAEDAVRLGLAMGLGAKAHQAEINAATERLFVLAASLVREGSSTPGGFCDRLLAAADGVSGGATEQEVLDLVVIAIFGGVDTTRAQLGHLLALFAEHPDQWSALRASPDRIPAAIEESLRARPTTTWATREALEDLVFGGEEIRAGETVHVLVHATARDPAVCTTAAFDIGAERKMHFGFGGGAHHCLGAEVARTDIGAALRVFSERIRSIGFSGQPAFLPESGNTGPIHLPLRLEPA